MRPLSGRDLRMNQQAAAAITDDEYAAKRQRIIAEL
jgi:hypothetical protein